MINTMAGSNDFEVIRETNQYVPNYNDLTSWTCSMIQIVGTDMTQWRWDGSDAPTRFQIRFQLRRVAILEGLKT